MRQKGKEPLLGPSNMTEYKHQKKGGKRPQHKVVVQNPSGRVPTRKAWEQENETCLNAETTLRSPSQYCTPATLPTPDASALPGAGVNSFKYFCYYGKQ